MRWDGDDMRKLFATITSAALCLSLTACSNPVATLETGLEGPVSPVGNYNAEGEPYTNEGTVETAIAEYTTDDGICRITVFDSYFEVTLDETSCTPYQAGAAYATAIRNVYPDFDESLESYIFENIRMAFPDISDDYTPVEDRMFTLYNSLDERYQQEISGLAETMCGDRHGIYPDNKISVEEMMLMQMVGDALRPTACSGLALWGSKTETGDMLTVRCLEWLLGSENQMARIHCVLHVVNGEKSFTSIGFLGILDVITGINHDGVLVATLDADCEEPYISEGRTCYTWALRHVLEEYDNAHDAAQYLYDNSGSYTFAHIIMVTDGNEALAAEDAPAQLVGAGHGHSVTRDASTPLMNDLTWDSPDSLCLVNSFVSQDNRDLMSNSAVNLVRFSKYNEWVSSINVFDLAALKNMMTQEIVDTELYGMNTIENVHRDILTQMILVDYHTGNVQVAFTGVEGVVDRPVFVDIGNYLDWA